MPDKFAIFTEGLVKRYKGKSNSTLNSLDLRIPRGSMYGLLAPNGAGKTTTIDILCGLKKFDSGRVMIDGLNVPSELGEIKKVIGLVPQEIALFPSLTGRENLKIIGGMYGVEGKVLNERVDDLLTRFGLENSADRQLTQYSGGMKRRINLLAGLLHKPKILILDEPTVGVDAQSRNLILEELVKINKEGTTVLFISHYLEEAECICDIVGLMDGGKIVLEGNPVELARSNPECKNLEALYIKLTGKQMRDTYE
ncbi:MAG: ABC transporter ATP-binding protein [Bacteroidales bacterium]|nr:ABC transporter ATP-binding protein [Bacteroidales bacterium]